LKKNIIILIFVFSIILLIHTSNPINAEHVIFHSKPPTTNEQYLEEINSYTISERITISTDKSEYFENEIIRVTGTSDINSMSRIFFWLITSDNVAKTTLIPVSNGTFSTKIYTSNLDLGLYTIGATDGNETAKTTFTYSSYPLTIQTNKQQYNEIETIQISGNIVNIPDGNNVSISTYDEYYNIMSPETLVSITNGVFSHSITTDGDQWRNYTSGKITIVVNHQNYTAETEFYYSDYPSDLSIYTLSDTDEKMQSDIDSMYATFSDAINSLQIQLNSMILNIFSNTERIISLEEEIEEHLYCGEPQSHYFVIHGTNATDILMGTDHDDLIFGDDGNDFIDGMDGNDCIFGEGGDDVLHGQDGDDTLDGGSGTDELYGDDGNDICIDGESLSSCETIINS